MSARTSRLASGNAILYTRVWKYPSGVRVGVSHAMGIIAERDCDATLLRYLRVYVYDQEFRIIQSVSICHRASGSGSQTQTLIQRTHHRIQILSIINYRRTVDLHSDYDYLIYWFIWFGDMLIIL